MLSRQVVVTYILNALRETEVNLDRTQETLRLHPIATGLPRVAVKDDVIPLAHPIISTTGDPISEIQVKAGQVFYASFAGYQRYD